MKRSLLVLAAIGTIASLSVFAQDEPAPKGKHPQGGPGGHMMMEGLLSPRLVDDLALTADQKAKYDELSAAFKKDAEQFRKDHPISDADKEAMKKARESGDKEAMKAAMEKMAAARKPLMETRKGYVDQFKATLTDEQKKTLEDKMAEFKSKMAEHGPRGHHPSGAGGPPPAAPQE